MKVLHTAISGSRREWTIFRDVDELVQEQGALLIKCEHSVRSFAPGQWFGTEAEYQEES